MSSAKKIYFFFFLFNFFLTPAIQLIILLLFWHEVLHCETILTCSVCFRLLSEILKETSEDIEEIEYLTDGSWRPIRDDKEKDRERERSNTPEYPVVDICTCQFSLFLLICEFLVFCKLFCKQFLFLNNGVCVCRHSWSKWSLTRPQQHKPVGQIWKRPRGYGWRRWRARCGTGRRRSGRSDSWLVLWGGRGRGGGRQWGHWGQRRQSRPKERPIQLRQGPGDSLLTPPALSLQRLTQPQRQRGGREGRGKGRGRGGGRTSRTGTQSSSRCNNPPLCLHVRAF